MKKRLVHLMLLLGIVISLLTGVVQAVSNKPAGLKNLYTQEWEVLRITNLERYKEGLYSLVTFDTMQDAAAIRAFESSIYFNSSHNRPDGSTPFTVLKELGFTSTHSGENMLWATGSAGTSDAAMKSWMNSSGHKANILNSFYRYLGVGYAVDRVNTNFYVQIFGNSKESDCAEISFNAEQRYFTLKLKNGMTAYAPYDEHSVNIQGNQMQFHYPGATTWFNLPPTDTTPLAEEAAAPISFADYTQFRLTPIFYDDLRKMINYAESDIGTPFLTFVYNAGMDEISQAVANKLMKYAMNNGLHMYTMDTKRPNHSSKNAADALGLSKDLGNPTNAAVPCLVYFDGEQLYYKALDLSFDQDSLVAQLKTWGLQDYNTVAPLGETYPEYDFALTGYSGLTTYKWEMGKSVLDMKPNFTDNFAHPYTLTSSNPEIVKINSSGKGFEVLGIGKSTITLTAQDGQWYTKSFPIEITGYEAKSTGLTLDKPPTKTTYKVEEALDFSGLELTYFETGSTTKLQYPDPRLSFTISGGYVTQATKLLANGSYTIHVWYNDRYYADFQIGVGVTVPATPTTPTTTAAPGTLADGWYNLRTMNNYVNLTAKGDAELRKLTTSAAYYAENKGNGQITLKLASGMYLGLSGTIVDGLRLKAVSSPYTWNLYSENNKDIFSLRPPADTKKIVNASGERSVDGTQIIIWIYETLDAPDHAEFQFVPTVAPQAPEQPVQPTQPTQPVQPKHSFTDVVNGSYYENAVVWALKNEVTSGISSTAFGPDVICTRGQVVTFLWRAKGSPEPKSTTNPFGDVKTTDYYYKPVLWAVEQGITSGTSTTTFSPQQDCTSAQVVAFLWRSNGEPAANQTLLSGRYAGQYYTDALAWSDFGGLLKGTGTAFAPNNKSPRADIVTYLYRNAGSPSIS